MNESGTAGSVPPPTTTSEPTTPPAPAAGWYPDPAGSGGKRYWGGSAWTGRTTPPETKPGPQTVAQSDAIAGLAEAAARLAMLQRRQRDKGVRGTTKRGFAWLLVIVIGLLMVGAITSIVSGHRASTPTSGMATDPCNQATVFAGKETIAEYKQACPKWQQYAAPTYPTTVPATAVVGGAAILGGTQSAWNAAYVPDPNVGGGAAFDPSPGSYPDNTDRLTSVNYDNGRVWDLTEALPPNTAITAAVPAVKKMLPADAKLSHVVVLDNCAALGITSATLGSEVGSPNAVAFFDSGTAGDHYDPTDVGEFSLSANETVPSSC